jgi:Ring finger domain
MESPPTVERVPTHGASVALQSSSPDFRTLMEESQGARPLSNIFGYRNNINPLNMSIRRSPYGQLFTQETFSAHGVSHPVESAVIQQSQQYPASLERLQDEDFLPSMYPDQSDPIGLHSFVASSNPSNSNPAEPRTQFHAMSRHSHIDLVTSYQPVVADSRSRKRNHDGVDHSSKKRPALASISTVPPGNLKTDADDLSDAGSCCICMCDPDEGELARIDACDHSFCFTCIEKWAERENTCPLCKHRFTRITRVDKSKRKKGQKGTKKVKERNQRADLNSSNALEGLLG